MNEPHGHADAHYRLSFFFFFFFFVEGGKKVNFFLNQKPPFLTRIGDCVVFWSMTELWVYYYIIPPQTPTNAHSPPIMAV